MPKKMLNKWKEMIGTLPDPKARPNDFERLVLLAMQNGMTRRDASRVFGLTERSLLNWKRKYGKVAGGSDRDYFIVRANKLGASDEAIMQWFGLQRPDQVAMIIAKADTDE